MFLGTYYLLVIFINPLPFSFIKFHILCFNEQLSGGILPLPSISGISEILSPQSYCKTLKTSECLGLAAAYANEGSQQICVLQNGYCFTYTLNLPQETLLQQTSTGNIQELELWEM